MMNIDDIYTLMEIIRRKESKDLLLRNQRVLLNKLYDEYVNGILIERGFNLDVDSIPTLIQKPELAELNRMYTERTIQDDALILEDCLTRVKKLDNKKKEEINLFKSLLKYKNKTVLLRNLYEETYKGILSKEEISQNKSNPEELRKFKNKLNGCILEETVGDIDLSNFDPKDFSTIGINMGTNIDPLLMVKALTPVAVLNLTSDSDTNVTFLNIADLHLDRDCFGPNGELDLDKLDENLISFIIFKDTLIKRLNDEGIKINGVVYSGDIFNAFTKVNAKWDVKRKDINKLVGAIINFERRGRSGEIVKDQNLSLGIKKEQAGFVSYLAGNHDMTLGREKFNKVMKLFGSSVVKPDIISLSNGSARIAIGSDLISMMHHSALDWGLGDELNFETRKARDSATFRFKEYLQIVQSFYDSLENDDPIKLQTDNNILVYDLLLRVNQKIKEENPELYNFYLPYLITNSNSPTNIYKIEHLSKFNVRPTTSFFRNFVVFENGKLETLIDERGCVLEPDIMVFKNFINNDGYFQRLDTAYNSIREKLPEEKRRKTTIPQFGRGDAYQPIITMLSHFHTSLVGSQKRRERKNHGLSKGIGKSKNRFINNVIEEGASKANKGYYSATQYRFEVSDNHVKRIYVKGLESDITLIRAVPNCILYAKFNEGYETVFNALKDSKKKLKDQ